MPNAPGNWLPRLAGSHTPHTGYLAQPLHAITPATALRNQASANNQAPQPGSYPAAALQPGDRRTSNQAAAAQLPANQCGCATPANDYFYRRIQHHITGKTDQPNGHKSLPFAKE
jgi:hypothetical protein